MLQPPKCPAGIMPEIEVVITKPSTDRKYHTELGIFPSHSFGVFAEPYGEDFELQPGDRIGMEWQTKGGKILARSREWAHDAFILTSRKNDNLNSPVRRSDDVIPHEFQYTGRTKIRVGGILSTLTAKEGDPDEWIEYIEKTQEYLKYLKYGLI